jgi:transposase
MVREFLGQDPLSGHLFLFLNRRRDRVKILFWERDGMVIWYKRLEAGTFQQLDPAARADHASGTAGLELTATDLALLLNGIDLATARRRKRYSRSGV